MLSFVAAESGCTKDFVDFSVLPEPGLLASSDFLALASITFAEFSFVAAAASFSSLSIKSSNLTGATLSLRTDEEFIASSCDFSRG